MGFRNGAYAKVWDEPSIVSDSMTKLRVSISRKNKTTGEYETDFSGFIVCIGTACAKKAANLAAGCRIKLGDVDVSTRYDKEKQKEFVSYKVFTFDTDGESESKPSENTEEPKTDVDDGVLSDGDLPF